MQNQTNDKKAKQKQTTTKTLPVSVNERYIVKYRCMLFQIKASDWKQTNKQKQQQKQIHTKTKERKQKKNKTTPPPN